MALQLYLRMAGYVGTLVMHITNLYVMQVTIKGAKNITVDTLEEVGIRTFRSMEYRYLTTWTVGLQINYAVLGLFCDILLIKNRNKKNYKLSPHLRNYRHILFSSMVWPSTMVVSTVFWTLFLYDRSLVFPEFLDKIVSSTSNHVLHTAIVPVALWEVLFRPRQDPRSHTWKMVHMALYMLAYAAVLHYTFQRNGVWLYPILEVVYGTVHFPLLHVYIVALGVFFYFAQWRLNSFIHRQHTLKKMK